MALDWSTSLPSFQRLQLVYRFVVLSNGQSCWIVFHFIRAQLRTCIENYKRQKLEKKISSSIWKFHLSECRSANSPAAGLLSHSWRRARRGKRDNSRKKIKRRRAGVAIEPNRAELIILLNVKKISAPNEKHSKLGHPQLTFVRRFQRMTFFVCKFVFALFAEILWWKRWARENERASL